MDTLELEGQTLHTQEVLRLYPALRNVYPPSATLDDPKRIHVPAGATLFNEDEPCTGFPLLLRGEVHVARGSRDGRSVELYRVVPGELCLVSSACLFRSEPMSAYGVATQPVTLLHVCAATFRAWMADPPFRDFVLGMFAQRMAELMALVEAVTFQRLDQRLAAALLGHGRELAVTHQQLADSLGTVREIVSRLLHRFAAQGWIALARERILILDGAALRRCAAGL